MGIGRIETFRVRERMSGVRIDMLVGDTHGSAGFDLVEV